MEADLADPGLFNAFSTGASRCGEAGPGNEGSAPRIHGGEVNISLADQLEKSLLIPPVRTCMVMPFPGADEFESAH